MRTFTIMQAANYEKLGNSAAQVREAGGCCCVVALPWEMIAPHEPQADKNHSQTLVRLDQRGGLSACEAVAVLEDRGYYAIRLTEAEAQIRLYELLQRHLTTVRLKEGCTHHRMTLNCSICERERIARPTNPINDGQIRHM